MKRKIEIIGHTLFLLVASLIIHYLWSKGVYSRFPAMPLVMITATMVYVPISFFLESIHKQKAAIALGTIVFVLLCICFVYALEAVDFKAFVLCMILVVRRSTCLCCPYYGTYKEKSSKKSA